MTQAEVRDAMMNEQNETQDQAAPEGLENPLGGDPVALLQQQLAEKEDLLLRTLAEQQNTLRRAEKQAQDARAFAIDRFAGDLIPVADYLRKALEAVPLEARSNEAVANLVVGVEMTERLMLDTFAKNGLRAVGAKGEGFDPNVHQAVAQIPSEAPAGAIAEVMQQGFVLNGRTVRPALVAVSLGQPGAAAPAAGGEPGGQVDVTV